MLLPVKRFCLVLRYFILWLGISLTAQASTVDAQRLSLPKGPGSVEGFGGKFEPSPASGTASYDVDIALPTAIAGFGPALSLSYDGGGGISELGMGWVLSGVPRVRRNTVDGLPRFDDSDRYELLGFGGPSELVEVSSNTYRLKDETGAFVRVKRASDGGTWEARKKNGITYRFGGKGYVEAEGSSVVTYLLREQYDLHGHKIVYEWDTNGAWAKLTKVTWNDVSDEARIEIRISYESRADVQLRFSSGIRQELDSRVRSIEVSRGGKLVRRYTLSYSGDAHSYLAKVVMVGRDGETAVPPLSFEYTMMRHAKASDVTVMKTPPGRSPGETNATLVDLNGDSLPDLLVGEAGAYRSYINRDGVNWQSGADWSSSNSPSVSLGSTGVQLADLDGDGALDLVIKSGTSSLRYLPGKDSASFFPSVAISTVPNVTFEDSDVRLADMDSDRRSDVVITTATGVAIGYNRSGKDWTQPESAGVVDSSQSLRFSDGRSTLCDINGDRVEDFCYLRSGSLIYWLGRGRGKFEVASTASGVPTFETEDPWKLIDLDGDGWLDLIHVGVSNVSYALASGIGQFGEVTVIDGTPEKTSTGHVEFVDMNGSGSTDILWVDVTGAAEEAWRYLELFPDGRAGLLTRTENGLGRVTHVEYASAASFAAKARDAGAPWSTRLNVGIPVVSRILIDSSLTDPTLETTIVYGDGAWDPKERSFAGFGCSVQREIGDESTPTLIVTTHYDTGLGHRVLRGLPTDVTTTDEAKTVYSTSTSTYEVRTLLEAMDGTPVEYGYKAAESTRVVEGQDALARTTKTEWEYDDFGSVTREAKWGDTSRAGDEVVNVRTYANLENDWILGYLASEEVLDADGNRLSMHRQYYDGEPFEGLPLGEIERGDLRRTDSWIDGDRFVTETRFEHDDDGNVITAIDVHGSRSEMAYDASGQFLTRERRYVDESNCLEWTAAYDEQLGVLSSLREPNGYETRVTYDALGRVTSVIKPGDSEELPTLSYAYELSSPLSKITVRAREQSRSEGTVDKTTLIDGLGRERASFLEGSGSAAWIMSGVVGFDARGNRAFEAYSSERNDIAFPSGLETLVGEKVTHDALGRTTVVRHPDGSMSRTEYGPFFVSQWDEDDASESSPHYGTPTTTYQDGLGRVVAVVEREGNREINTAEYRYNALGKLLSATDALGRERKFSYDGRARRLTVDDPNAGLWRFTYADSNDLVSRLGPDKSVVRYEYDGLGRPVIEREQTAESDEKVAVRYHYDAVANEYSGLTNVKGQLAWVEDSVGQAYFGYDERGRVVDRIRRWLDGKEHHDWTDYDAQDRPIRRGFPDKTHLSVTYDSRGLLASVGSLVSEIKWEPNGGIGAITFGNGVVDVRTYDTRQRLVRMVAENKHGSLLRGFQLSLDDASQISGVSDLRSNISAEESLTTKYTYDDRYRLINATYSAGDVNWELDDLAKVLEVSSSFDEPHLNVENRYGEGGASPDQLTSHGDEVLEYDAAGRVIKDGERTLDYDANGRLIRVMRGAITEEYGYAYDGTRAIKKTTRDGKTDSTRYIAKDVEERDGDLIRYVLVGEQRVARLDATDVGARTAPVTSTSGRVDTRANLRSNDVLWRTLWAVLASSLVVACATFARRTAKVIRLGTIRTYAFALLTFAIVFVACGSNGEKRSISESVRAQSREITEVPASAEFYLSDAQLSPLVVVDSAGSVKSRSLYHAYGQVRYQTSEHGDPFGYVGNEEDRGSGLSDFYARPYRPELGIFLAVDPVGLFESDSTIGKPNRGEGYVYGEGNPINVVDRDGRCGTPTAPPGMGCERYYGPQLPAEAQKAIDAGAMKGTLIVLEGLSFMTPVADGAAAVRALANPAVRKGLVHAAKLGFKALAKRIASFVAKKEAPKVIEKAATALRFGEADLVYGPSAKGALRQLQESAGGRLLTDIGGPASGQSWAEFSIQTMKNQFENGGKLRFDLTHMDDIPGALKNTGKWADSTTAQELRWIQSNWGKVGGNVNFYRNGAEVAKPW